MAYLLFSISFAVKNIQTLDVLKENNADPVNMSNFVLYHLSIHGFRHFRFERR